MRFLAVFTALLMISGVVFGRTIVSVKDKSTLRPIELVNIMSESSGVFATTNADGQADLSAFDGIDSIEFRRIGYSTAVISLAELQSHSFVMLLEPAVIVSDEVVVSAARWRQNSSSIPSKIVSLSPIELDLQSPQTAADMLGVSGEVFIQKSQQGGGSPMIRGFATNRLLYAIDGVRMNTAIFRGGNIQNVISLDPFAIEHTEVLFGPGSVIYGSDAIGGVMSFQTLVPQLSFSDEVLINGMAVTRYSSANNEKTGHFDVNVGSGKWASVTSITSFDFDHLKQGNHGPADYIKPYYVQRQDTIDRVITQDDPLLQIPSAYSQVNLTQKIRYKPAISWDLQYAFHYSETSPYGRYDRHNRTRNGTARYAEWNYGPQKWMMNLVSIEHYGQLVVYDQLTARFAQQSFEESRIDRSLNNDVRSIRNEKVDAYSVNLDFMRSVGAENTLFYGLEYVANDVHSTGIDENIATGTSAPGPARYPQATWQSIAAYFSDQYNLSSKVTLQAGLRYNQYLLDAEFDTTFYPFPFTSSSLDHGSLTGSMGGLYRPSHDWLFRINVATAFRSPNVDDVGKVFDSEPGSVVVPNPDLEAERAYCVDFDVAWLIGEAAKADFAVFYTSLDNAMVRRDFSLNGLDSIIYDGTLSRVQAIQNAAKADVYGVQAGLEIELPQGFGISTDLNYQKGEEELEDGSKSPSRHAAPVFGVSRFTYSSDGIRMEFYAMYQGERKHEDLADEEKAKNEIYAADVNGNTYSPSWYTLNFKAHRTLTQELAITAGVENLTDQRYRPYSSGISGPGRNFFLTLSAEF